MFSLLIVNPNSGQDKAAREKRKLLDLAPNMPHIHAVIPTWPDEAVELARNAAARGYDRVLVAGGDGTINLVVNGIGDSRIPLGIIPLGTGNVLAHDLGIPHNDAAGAMSVIEANKIRDIDVGRANGRRFLLMAGLGFDAEVVGGVRPKIKDIFGTMAYAGPIIQQLVKYTPARFKLTFDNGYIYEAEAYAVILANCGSYAYNLRIAPQAIFDDGLLDIVVFETGPGAKLRFLSQAFEVLFQQTISDLYTTYAKSSWVRIETDPPVKMQLDGDVCGESAVEVEALHKALRLIVP